MDAEAHKDRQPRYLVDFVVVCRFRGQEQQGRALNLSRGGVLLSTPDLLPVGIFAEVIFTVPGAELIQFKGIVRHASEERGTGVEFLEVLPRHQARLAAYLDALV